VKSQYTDRQCNIGRDQKNLKRKGKSIKGKQPIGGDFRERGSDVTKIAKKIVRDRREKKRSKKGWPIDLEKL